MIFVFLALALIAVVAWAVSSTVMPNVSGPSGTVSAPPIPASTTVTPAAAGSLWDTTKSGIAGGVGSAWVAGSAGAANASKAAGEAIQTGNTAISAPPKIIEGQAYTCDGVGIFRGVNGTLRVYPNPTIAASWDLNWANPIKLDCSKLERGPPMDMSPSPALIEGHPYTCADGGVYRAMGGMLRWYPSPDIASSWDPGWATPIKVDCSTLKKGAPMDHAPSPALAAGGSLDSAPAPVPKADTSAMESRMKAIVNDLNQQHANGYFRTNSGNVKINEAEYNTLAPKLTAAGVSWTKPKYDPNSPTNALLY